MCMRAADAGHAIKVGAAGTCAFRRQRAFSLSTWVIQSATPHDAEMPRPHSHVVLQLVRSAPGQAIMRREPLWACENYHAHGEWAVCGACLERFREQGSSVATDLPPPVAFGRGWFSVGAVHWFAATDSTIYVARDGRRVLAQAACGGICDVTTARAPHPNRECCKCLRALGMENPELVRPTTGGPPLRIYRGLKEPYDSTRAVKDRRSYTDFTDSPFWALQYASGRRGVVLVVDIPEGAARVSEELWLGPKAKRLALWGPFDKYITAQLPAKELRVEMRRKGIVTLDEQDKAQVLARYVAQRLHRGEPHNDRSVVHWH